MFARLFPLIFLPILLACSGSHATHPGQNAQEPPSPPTAVALALHADAQHTMLVLTLQDLDKTAERLMATLESLPETTRRTFQDQFSRAKLQEQLGFDVTKRAGWDDIGVDAAPGVLMTLDDRWPQSTGSERQLATGSERQLAIFLRLSHAERWKALLQKRNATVTLEDGVEVWQFGAMTLWLTQSGPDVLLVPVPKLETPEAKALFRKTFLEVAHLPQQPLDKAQMWKLAVRDGGRPWLLAWARTGKLAADAGPNRDTEHVARLFPQFALWLGDLWALRAMTSPLAQQALGEIFVPEKTAPLCASLIPPQGWAAARLSLHLEKLTDGLLRLAPAEMPPTERAVLGASLNSALALSGLPPGDIMAAWNGHVCAAVDIASMPAAVRGSGLPQWLLVLGVQDGLKADAVLATLADLWRNQAMKVTATTIAGIPGYTAQLGPLTLALVRDRERVIAGPSAQAIEDALARVGSANLAASGMAEALDGRVVAGVIVDVRTTFEVIGSFFDGLNVSNKDQHDILQSFGASLTSSRFFGLTLKLEEGALSLGPAATVESGVSPTLLVGVLAALAIPQFKRYATRAKTAEVKVNLREIRMLAQAWFASEHVDKAGKLLPARFPQTTLLTPGVSCCDAAVDRDGDQRCDADPTPWQQTGWKEMGFQPQGQQSFRYRFESSGTGENAAFTITAIGDLDCDGQESNFTVIAKPCKSGRTCQDGLRIEERESMPEE